MRSCKRNTLIGQRGYTVKNCINRCNIHFYLVRFPYLVSLNKKTSKQKKTQFQRLESPPHYSELSNLISVGQNLSRVNSANDPFGQMDVSIC